MQCCSIHSIHTTHHPSILCSFIYICVIRIHHKKKVGGTENEFFFLLTGGAHTHTRFLETYGGISRMGRYVFRNGTPVCIYIPDLRCQQTHTHTHSLQIHRHTLTEHSVTGCGWGQSEYIRKGSRYKKWIFRCQGEGTRFRQKGIAWSYLNYSSYTHTETHTSFHIKGVPFKNHVQFLVNIYIYDTKNVYIYSPQVHNILCSNIFSTIYYVMLRILFCKHTPLM